MHPSFRTTHERWTHSFELAGSTLLCALLTGACGGAFSERAPVQHRAGPAAGYGAYSTFTPQDLVHAGTGAAPDAYARRRPNIDAYLAPNRARVARAAPVMPSRPAASPSRRAASPSPTPTPTLVASVAPSARLAPTPTQPATSDLERYAARENRASKQMQYRGGDVIIITASTLIIILLVVILILLIT